MRSRAWLWPRSDGHVGGDPLAAARAQQVQQLGRGADTDIFQDSKQLCMTTREKCLEEAENNLLPLKLLFSTHTYKKKMFYALFIFISLCV